MRWLICGYLMLVMSAWAQPHQSDLWQAYQEHRWAEAEQALAGVHTWRAQMAAGWAACRLKGCERSLLYFRQAVWFARTDRQRAEALLNLGNAFYRLGRYAEAVDSFANALVYQPDFKAARNNLAVAENALRHWLAQQRLKFGRGGGKRKAEDSFAFAGGQKPAGNGQRDAWDNRIDSLRDRGPDLVSGQQALEMRDSNSPQAQLARARKLDTLARARLVERFTRHLSRLRDDQWALQMRLFERAEGFEAAQDHPHDIKGAAPW